MTAENCPSCGFRLSPDVIRSGPSARCPRCGDAVAPHPDSGGVTVTHNPDPGLPPTVASFLPAVADDTLAELRDGDPPPDARRAVVPLDAGDVTIALRRLG